MATIPVSSQCMRLGDSMEDFSISGSHRTRIWSERADDHSLGSLAAMESDALQRPLSKVSFSGSPLDTL